MSDGIRARIRLWHASRDAYHCAFRLLRAVSAQSDSQMHVEWLRIVDLYLLYPPLLHRVSLGKEMREQLNATGIPTPKDLFIDLPSSASIFRDLRIYQNTAVQHLAARTILDKVQLGSGMAVLQKGQIPIELQTNVARCNVGDQHLLAFLMRLMSTFSLSGSDSIYRRAGLSVRYVTP